MNTAALKSFIALRIVGAERLLAGLPAEPSSQRVRAQATLESLKAIDADKITEDKELLAVAKSAAVKRDGQRRNSTQLMARWIAFDAEHDVFVALYHDLNPTPAAEYGEGSNPAPVEEAAAAN
jgi:hypothetical protein